MHDGEIVLRIDRYDDIFSVFDIRPYTHRSLSDDFLYEIKRASADKQDGDVTLHLQTPKRSRKASSEVTIKSRLTTHFRKHYHLMRRDKKRITRRGLAMVVVGVICMISATLLIFRDAPHDLMSSFLIVFLEPAAWFLLWEGMDQIIFNAQKVNPDLAFYRKMAHDNLRIHFTSY